MLIWMRHESRPNEARAPLTPDGAAALIAQAARVIVEDSVDRCIPTRDYAEAGCEIVPAGSWIDAPAGAIILGLKELPEDGTPLKHRHIMFGHAYKGQPSGRVLLDRFKTGGGTLLDLEYLVDRNGRRVAAFGYWAGYAGAAVSLRALAAQKTGVLGPQKAFTSAAEMARAVKSGVDPETRVIVIGALGRVGSGATDLCKQVGLSVTQWDMAETAHGGPFPEILEHDVFLNCILAMPGVPVFVPSAAKTAERSLRVIGDIACDPDSAYSPIKVYDHTTTWADPVLRVHDAPPLDVMAIDNLPSMLPRESTEDFAAQLLPHLKSLADDPDGVWARADATFRAHI